jgi:hypothetical protein
MTRGRWASFGVYLIYAPIGVGCFLVLGWTWVGLGAFLAICVAGSLIADRVFARTASLEEKREVTEEQLNAPYD